MARLGYFSKFLATAFSSKIAQILGDFLGYFEKCHFKIKTAVATIWATWETYGLLLLLRLVTLDRPLQMSLFLRYFLNPSDTVAALPRA